MKKLLFILIFASLIFKGNSQISIDSLMTQIRQNYFKRGTKPYLGETFTIFESQDKKDRFDIFLDSANRIQENIGLAIVHYLNDSLNRMKLIEGFDNKGTRNYWDFPQVSRYDYVNDTVIHQLNLIKNELCHCQSADTLANVQIIKEINSGADSIYNYTRYTVYSIDSTASLAFSLSYKGKITHDRENVSYVYQEFNKVNKRIILHERYYDAELKLKEGSHDYHPSENVSISSHLPYAYSIRELENGAIKTINFYNRIGELVYTQHIGFNSEGPVNVPFEGYEEKRKNKLFHRKRK